MQHYQGLHCLPFSAFRSEYTLLAIRSSLIKVKVYTVILMNNLIRVHTICHSFWAVLWKSTQFAILSSLIRVYTICHSQQSDQDIHCLLFSAVWSESTLFAILSKQFYQGLHCFPFLAVRSGSTSFTILSSLIRVYTVCHSQQSGQGLHYLLFSVWWASKLFAILSSLIRVYTISHSFSAALSRSALFAILSILITVYTTCHSQQSDQGQGLHCHSHE